MASIIGRIRCVIKGKVKPVIVLREFGNYDSKFLADAELALRMMTAEVPESKREPGVALIWLCLADEHAEHPERVALPTGEEVIFLDSKVMSRCFSKSVLNYERCMDVARRFLLAGHTPDYATAEAWRYAKADPKLIPFTQAEDALERMTNSIYELANTL